jgi:hypothetical protein
MSSTSIDFAFHVSSQGRYSDSKEQGSETEKAMAKAMTKSKLQTIETTVTDLGRSGSGSTQTQTNTNTTPRPTVDVCFGTDVRRFGTYCSSR